MQFAKHNVCLIDDDNIYQFTARKIIESTGLAGEIKSFYNGKEAIDFFTSEAGHNPESLPDVIFLDINMPIMNGWEFLDEYTGLHTSFPKHIVVYVVSSSIDDNDMRKSRGYQSVTDYIVKPVNRSTYQELLENLK